MRRVIGTAALAACAALACAQPVVATPIVGFRVEVKEGFPQPTPDSMPPWMAEAWVFMAQDMPVIEVTNLSTSTSITSFKITIGDTRYSFRSVDLLSPADLDPTSLVPGPGDDANKVRLTYAAGDFQPLDVLRFRVDIDRDSDGGSAYSNFRNVMIGRSDPAERAKITVKFASGEKLTTQLSRTDDNGNPLFYPADYTCNPYTPYLAPLTAELFAKPVPEPATAVLALLAVAGALGAVLYRRRP